MLVFMTQPKHNRINTSMRDILNKLETLNDKKTEKDKTIIDRAEKKAKQIELKKEQQIKKALEDKQKTIDALKDKTTQELADKMKEEFKL